MADENWVSHFREYCTHKITCLAIRFAAPHTLQFKQKFSSFALDLPKQRVIINDPENVSKRLFLLRRGLKEEDIPIELRDFIRQEHAEIVQSEVTQGYEALTTEEVLRELLGPNVELPLSFETVGHIAHLNLREELLPFKRAIGRIHLDIATFPRSCCVRGARDGLDATQKAPSIRTVVTKIGIIENEFRVLPLEVIAGDPNLVTEREHGCRFRFDYSQVYWNSRLQEEHARLASLMRPGDVLADMFAGVGPFAIPVAQRGAFVYANDLNPASAAALRESIRLNKVSALVRPFNKDGRAFFRELIRACCDSAAAAAAASPCFTPAQHATTTTPSLTTTTISTLATTATPVTSVAATVNEGMCASAEAGTGAGDIRSPRMNGAADTQLDCCTSGGGGTGAKKPAKREGKRTQATLAEFGQWEFPTHVAMNLPALGPEFCDAFVGAYRPAAELLRRGLALRPPPVALSSAPEAPSMSTGQPVPDRPTAEAGVTEALERLMPFVHCYGFTREPPARRKEAFCERIERAWSCVPPPTSTSPPEGGLRFLRCAEVTLHEVRDVAPNKIMVCISFRLPVAVAIAPLPPPAPSPPPPAEAPTPPHTTLSPSPPSFAPSAPGSSASPQRVPASPTEVPAGEEVGEAGERRVPPKRPAQVNCGRLEQGRRSALGGEVE